MGNTRFTPDAYASAYTTRGLTAESHASEVFKNRTIPQALDPMKIDLRESRDSDSNPKSTALILGLDVTGSMEFILEQLAKVGLPRLMKDIYEQLPITDPHIMFMGIGDACYDSAPLQVSQFEAGAEPLIEQLLSMWLEAGGGGNSYESYNLPWYFAAHKTAIDCFEKRGKKGLIFTIGDEMPPQELTPSQLTRIFGKSQYSNVDNEELLNLVRTKYSVFHVIAEEGSYARSRENAVRQAWTALLGPNALFLRDHTKLSEIITATLRINSGENINTVINESQISAELKYAFSNALGENAQ
jgi:hypothetical protein